MIILRDGKTAFPTLKELQGLTVQLPDPGKHPQERITWPLPLKGDLRGVLEIEFHRGHTQTPDGRIVAYWLYNGFVALTNEAL